MAGLVPVSHLHLLDFGQKCILLSFRKILETFHGSVHCVVCALSKQSNLGFSTVFAYHVSDIAVIPCDGW